MSLAQNGTGPLVSVAVELFFFEETFGRDW